MKNLMGMLSGGEWIGKTGRRYTATYNFHHDLFNCPSPGVYPVAHFSYSRGGKPGGGDIFLTEDLGEVGIRHIKKNKLISLQNNLCVVEGQKGRSEYLVGVLMDAIPPTYDVQVQLRRDLSKSMKEDILAMTYADIFYFCKEDIAKTSQGPRVGIVDKISARTEIKRVEPARILDGGKQWFVPECLLTANLDFGKGCATSIHIGDNATYSNQNGTEIVTNHFFAPHGECDYCYAGRKHKSFLKTFHIIPEQELERLLNGEFCPTFGDETPLGRPVDYVRLGKRTESWTQFTQNEFQMSLEVMIKTGTRGIIPTKMLPFRKDLVPLFKKSKSVILYSLGFDEFERGAVLQGCNNEWRWEQLLKYREAGVNAVAYVHIFGGNEPTKREKNLVERNIQNKIPIQLLPLRWSAKKLFHGMTGLEWGMANRILQHQQSFFEDTQIIGGYEVFEKQLKAIIHPQWEALIGENNGMIRMCHHNSIKTYCGKCFQTGHRGNITPTIHVKKEFSGRKNNRKKKPSSPNEEQPKFFEY